MSKTPAPYILLILLTNFPAGKISLKTTPLYFPRHLLYYNYTDVKHFVYNISPDREHIKLQLGGTTL